MTNQHWIVVSPEFPDIIPVMDDGSGPTVWECLSVSVSAETRSEAKRLALHHADMQDWVNEQRGNNRNPLWGLKVYRGKCKHGVCQCDICFQDCPQCIAEAEADHASHD